MLCRPLDAIERGRIVEGEYKSPPGVLYGAFQVTGPCGDPLLVMSSGIDLVYGWEHVSVSLRYGTPVWEEMCFIKGQFWGEDETVIQYHPAKVDYVNHHEHCLHLWRPVDGKIRIPPSILVGPQGETAVVGGGERHETQTDTL